MPLPSGYGVDQIVLQVRDPRWLHAYWELKPSTVAQGRLRLRADGVDSELVLRVIEEEGGRSFDILLDPLATDRTFQVDPPDRTWAVEIGLKARSGQFLPLARSNRVKTPPEQPSEQIDEAWRPLPEELPAEWPSPSSR